MNDCAENLPKQAPEQALKQAPPIEHAPPSELARIAVSLQGLGMRFGPAGKSTTLQALDDICTNMPAGSITGVVGPDAAGKTTLMRILAGLMRPTQGIVEIFGQAPELCASEGHIGYMPQRFGLYEDLTVHDNLLLHARLRGLEGAARQELFARLLDFTSLAPFTTRLAGRLSGGMKQKLGIACALLGRPRILLLDEPGVGVDPQSRRELWRMVQNLCGDGMTIVWATAYLEEAERCPQVLMLDNGKVLYQGTPEALTKQAEGRVFAVRPSAKVDSKTLLTHWSGLPGVCDALIQGGHVRVVLAAADAPHSHMHHALHEAGATALPPRLEDAYMNALGGISQQPSPFAALAHERHDAPAPNPHAASANATVSAATPIGAPLSPPISVDLPPIRIEAHGLTRHFGDFVAARDITFSVRAGEIFGLLGPNGAGKSTTFRMLCGLLRPSAGRCSVDGVDMLTAGSEARSRLGYMAQKFSLYQDIPVHENINIMADLYGVTAEQRQRIPQIMDALELTNYASKATGSLPLGHKQRLALLCATVHQPPVLFLDEPTSGVDARTRREFWKHITALTRAGAAVLVTTHFMEEAEYCDAIALVYQGGIIARGTPDSLKEHAPIRKQADMPLNNVTDEVINGVAGGVGGGVAGVVAGGVTDGVTLEEAFIAYIEEHDAKTREEETEYV